jgi:hypothetical protein
MVGYFPMLCLLEAETAGVFLPTNLFTFDGSALRSEARSLRQTLLREGKQNRP